MIQKLVVHVMSHEELSGEQLKALSTFFPGTEIIVVDIDMDSPEKHLVASRLYCNELQAISSA